MLELGELAHPNRSILSYIIHTNLDFHKPFLAHISDHSFDIDLRAPGGLDPSPLTRRRSLFSPLLLAILFLVSAADDLQAQRRPDSWIVRLRPGATLKSVRASIEVNPALARITIEPAISTTRSERPALLSATGLDRYFVVRAVGAEGSDLRRSLALSPYIEEIAPNHVHSIAASPNDSAYGEQWALRAVDAEGAWRTTRGESAVIVGIVDTGLDFLHPDLVGAMAINRPEDINGNGRFDPWSSSQTIAGVRGDIDGLDQDGNGLSDDVIGFDFIDQNVPNPGDWQARDPIPEDEFGHGTNAAGIVAATADNGIGISGLAPNVRLLALRAFDATGNGEDDDIAAAIVYAADRGVRVLNLSFGDLFYSSLMRDAIRYAIERGVVVVASSGNDGGSGRHYPSNYSGVISVGATDVQDRVPFFSTFGSQLSLVAPGVDVITTGLNGGYVRVGGTSFAAPHVAATAALILSLHPSWRPDEVRTAIELSADDDRNPGWDIYFGAGRLNARRAVELPGPARLEITSPEVDDGLAGLERIVVRGSAVTPFLESWELSLGLGDLPTEWRSLSGSRNEGRLDDTLGSFTIDGIPDTTITLRLTMRLSSGRSSERRIRLHVDRSAPVILSQNIEQVWRYQERAVAITLKSDDLSRLTAWVRRSGVPGEPYRPIALEAERTGLVRDHFLLLTSADLDPDVRYDLYILLVNTAGDTVMIGSPTAPLGVTRSSETAPREGYDRRAHTLPYGYTLDRVDTIAGKKLIALNRFERGDYGKLLTFGFEGGRFVPNDSIAIQWLPRDFGDSDGDGLRELLVQSLGSTIIYEQTTPGGSILESSRFVDTTTGDLWGSRLADLDRDGRDELIARGDNSAQEGAEYRVLRFDGAGLDTLAKLPNTTRAASDETRNLFGPPISTVGDFDGDGRLEILFGDNDADFLVYERQDDGSYVQVWVDENEGEGGSEMIASADIDGDGRSEIITGYRSLIRRNLDNEFDAPLWTIRIHRLTGDGTATLIWSDRFAYVRPTNPFRSGISTGELDGLPGEEIVLTIFPGLYLFGWDAVAGRVVPRWHLGGVSSPGDRTARNSTLWFGAAVGNASLVADFDGDGVAEVGAGNGDSIYFFQRADDSSRTISPTGLRGWATGRRSVQIEWNAVAGADRYTIYRGARVGDGTIVLDSIGSLTQTLFLDTVDLPDNEREVAYAVVAVDDAKRVPESRLPGVVIVVLHELATITAIEQQGERGLRLELGASTRDEIYRPATIDIRSNGVRVGVSSVVWASERGLLVTLEDPRPGERLDVRLTSHFRDYFGSPGDTISSIAITMDDAGRPGERFIATRAELAAAQTIAIDFNAPVDEDDALRREHYSIDPVAGDIDSVYMIPGDGKRVYLVISRALPLGPNGRFYTVTIRGLRSADGRLINDGAGSVVGLALNGSTVDASFVYPQPFSITRDEQATIAGLPIGAEVTIFSQRGVLIQTLRATEGNGGVNWNGRDQSGAPVASGIYLYQVTASDGRESALRKIAVIR